MPRNRTINALARASRNTPGYPPIVCHECATPFLPYRKLNIRFCSTRCRASFNRRRVKPPPASPRPCAKCGAEFLPYRPTVQRFCSLPCLRLATRERPMTPAQQLRRKQRQRAYSKGVVFRHGQMNAKSRRRAAERRGSLTIDEWRTIVDRFDGACAYCTKRDVRLTVDHVVPLSRGGAHSMANVVPACRSCNSAKRDRDWSGRILCP